MTAGLILIASLTATKKLLGEGGVCPKVIGGGGSLSKKRVRGEGYLQSTENISLRVARPETQWERDVRNVGHTTVV